MATEFTHIFVSTVLGRTLFPDRMPVRFWVLTALCAMAPDIDIFGFYVGIKYADVFGHRGFSHSLLFAAAVGLIAVTAAFPGIKRFSRQWWGMAAFFSSVVVLHDIFDAMTDKGLGVGFFIPFDEARYVLPWRPIIASPMRITKFFSRAGMEVLAGEILWIWIPVLAAALIVLRFRRNGKRYPAC